MDTMIVAAGSVISNVIFFFPLILLPLFTSVIIKRFSTKRPPLPPGPYPWPILGNLFQMGKKNPHVTLAKLAQIHGPLMLLKLGAQPLVVASSPAAAREILKTHDRQLSGRYVSHPIQFKGSKLHNLSLAFMDDCGDQWKRIRGAYKADLFSAKALESQAATREKKVMEMVKYLGSKDGHLVKIKEMALVTAANILGNALVSRDFVDFEGKGIGEGMLGNIRRYNDLGGEPQLADMYPILGDWDFQGYYNKLMDIFDRICAVWIDIVEQRRNRNRNDHLSAPIDFADTLIDSGFSNDEINSLFMVLSLSLSRSLSLSTHTCMYASILLSFG